MTYSAGEDLEALGEVEGSIREEGLAPGFPGHDDDGFLLRCEMWAARCSEDVPATC